MLYHIKIVEKNKNNIYFYDKDKDFAKSIKEQFYKKGDIRIEGHIIVDNDKMDCYIIKTAETCEQEVAQRNLRRIDNPRIINNFNREMLFNEYKNIIDEI